jgi:ketosteroid isomerase-like protein
MRKAGLLLIPVMLVCLPLTAEAREGSEDENAIRQVVSDYVAACRNANVEAMRKVLHPQAKLFLPSTGKTHLIVQTPSELYKNFNSKPRQESDMLPMRDAGLSVERLDVTGEVASVKIKVNSRGSEIIEHLSLMKFADGWKIVCRVMSVWIEGGQPKSSR